MDFSVSVAGTGRQSPLVTLPPRLGPSNWTAKPVAEDRRSICMEACQLSIPDSICGLATERREGFGRSICAANERRPTRLSSESVTCRCRTSPRRFRGLNSPLLMFSRQVLDRSQSGSLKWPPVPLVRLMHAGCGWLCSSAVLHSRVTARYLARRTA